MKYRNCVLCLVILSITLSISMAMADENRGIAWAIEGDTLIISGKGRMPSYSRNNVAPWAEKEIKNIIIENGITSISAYAFYSCKKVESIVMPDTISEIEGYAFYSCESLKSISLPNEVEEVYPYAFSNCNNLEIIILSESLERIDDFAFYGCKSLSKITIPDNVLLIGQYAFSGCNQLNEITIPNKTQLSWNCLPDSLMNIFVEQSNPYYSSVEGVLYSKDETTLIRYPAGRKEEIYTVLNSVHDIEYHAFLDSSLKYIILPSNLISIGKYAFENCKNLQEILIPNSVTSIGDGAFESCVNLKKVVLSRHMKSIRSCLFRCCYNLSEIRIPDNIYWIEPQAFYSTALSEVSLPYSVKYVGEKAFSSCFSLKTVIFLNENIEVEYDSFDKERIELIRCFAGSPIEEKVSYWNSEIEYLDESLQKKNRFENNLIWKYVPETDTVIISGQGAIKDYAQWMDYPRIYDCTSPWNNFPTNQIVIDEGIESIGEYVFYNCKKLESIVLPASVVQINKKAIYGCSNLLTIICSEGSYADSWAQKNGYIVNYNIEEFYTSIEK